MSAERDDCDPATAGCRFPASPNPEVFAAQKTLVEAWRVVAESYVDDHFGGHDWPQVRCRRSAFHCCWSVVAQSQIVSAMLQKESLACEHTVDPSCEQLRSAFCPPNCPPNRKTALCNSARGAFNDPLHVRS